MSGNSLVVLPAKQKRKTATASPSRRRSAPRYCSIRFCRFRFRFLQLVHVRPVVLVSSYEYASRVLEFSVYAQSHNSLSNLCHGYPMEDDRSEQTKERAAAEEMGWGVGVGIGQLRSSALSPCPFLCWALYLCLFVLCSAGLERSVDGRTVFDDDGRRTGPPH